MQAHEIIYGDVHSQWGLGVEYVLLCSMKRSVCGHSVIYDFTLYSIGRANQNGVGCQGELKAYCATLIRMTKLDEKPRQCHRMNNCIKFNFLHRIKVDGSARRGACRIAVLYTFHPDCAGAEVLERRQ